MQLHRDPTNTYAKAERERETERQKEKKTDRHRDTLFAYEERIN